MNYYENETATGTPKATWEFKTNESGVIRFNNDYKSSGPALPINPANNRPGVPAGSSISIKEKTAPAGYQLDSATYKIAFKDAGEGKIQRVNLVTGTTIGTVNVSNAPDLAVDSKETPGTVSINVTKKANGTMPTGATLDGVKFALVSRNGSKPVVVGNKTYTGNNTILEILTVSGSNGAATATVTSKNKYPAGNYRVYELRSDATYQAGDTWDGNSAKHGSSNTANAHFGFATNQLDVTISGVQATAGTTISAGTATNTPSPKYFDATVKKVDAAGRAVAGAKFNLRYDGTDHVGTTGADGSYTWKNIPWTAAGTSATLTETSAPAGYQIDPAYAAPGKSITLKADPGATYNLGTVTNTQLVKIKINKQADGTMPPGATLDGIRFVIITRNGTKPIVASDGKTYSVNNTVLEVLTIKNSGSANTATVTSTGSYPVGNYRVFELRSDATYQVGDVFNTNGPLQGSSPNANAHFKYAINTMDVAVDGSQVAASATVTAGTATNTPSPKYFDATVKKVDNAGKAVAGATFILRYDGTDHVGTTGADGSYTWKNIPWTAAGTAATLIETKAPAGYQIDPAYAAPGKSITLKADPGATFNLGTVTNASVVSATLKKVDDAGQPIAGVVFNLKYDNADHKKTTGADGTATWTGIISGTKATLIEESVPAGYNMDPAYVAPGKSLTITANAGETYNLGSITNTPQLGKVQVKKVVAKVQYADETKVDLSGFTFRLTGTSLLGKAVNMTAVTNADGIALFENVPFGNNYSVKEELTNAQKAIWNAADDMPVTVSASAMGSAGYVPVNVTNTPIPGSLTIVKVVPEGEKTGGAGFNFLISGTSDAGYTYSRTVTTDATGKVTVNGIPYGTYSVEENLTAEQQKVWETKSADSVTINAQKQEVTFTFTQTEKTTQVTLKKVSEDGKVQGFKFTITGTRSIGGSFTKSGTTDAKGEIDFGKVPYGNYTVEENLTAAQKLIYGEPTINPESFTLSDENQTQGIVATAKNELIRGQIKVVKTDKETGDGSVQGNASLEGIQFAIVNRTGETAFLPNGSEIADGAIVAILSTDKKGEAATPAEYLQMGKYEVVELRKDSVFNVGDAYDAKAANTGESILANDSYLYAEQKQPATLAYKGTPNPTVDMAYSDTVVKGGVSIVKKDAELADGAQGNGSLAGIRFAIINTSQEKVLVGDVVIEPDRIAAIITTNAEGKAECTANLPYGTYKLVELWVNSGAAKGEALPALPTGDGILANDSYLWDKNEQTITLTENGVVKAAEKEATNRVVEGHIKVVKVDEETEETQGDTSLADIYFAIVNDSANTVMIGTTRVEKGAVAAVVKTNEKGECETGELPYGSYTVYEMRMDAEKQGIIGKAWADVNKGTSVYANASYLWAENKQPMSVTKHNEIKVTPKETNKPVPGSLEIIKTDAEMTATQGDAVLTGIKYAIINMSAKAVKVNGTVYGVGQVVEIVTLNAEGKAYSSSLPYGTYRVVELRKDATIDLGDKYEGSDKLGVSTYANDSYQWSEQSKTQTVRENGKQYSLNYENIPTKGKASVTKTDTENMTPEGDATFEGIRYAVINRSFSALMIGETKVEKGAVAAVVILDKNGKATTAEDLPYGTYDVVELRRDAVAKIGAVLVEGESIYANASYLYKNQVKPIKVREEGKVYETSFDNTPVKGGISLEKKDDKHDTAQGDASLAGIRFAIVNRSAKEVWVKGVKVEKNAVAAVLTTDKDGKAKTGNMDLPYGTYEVIELRMDAAGFEVGTMWNDVVKGESIYANASYLYKAFSQTVKTRIHGEIVPCEVPFTNPVVRGGVSITKRDFYTDDIPQGDAGFIGVRYAVINRSAEEVLLPDGTVIPKDAVALVLTADKDGKAQSSAKALAYGTYDVIELRIDSVAEIGKEVVMGSHEMANYSYLWKNLVHRIEVREEGKIYEATKDGKVFENEPEEPKNPELFKYDLDLGTNKTQGGASFEGIRFALINRSANPVFVEHFEKLFVPGQVIDVIKSTAEGIIELPYTMSYGTYGLMELSTLSTVKQGDMFDEISDIVKYGVSEDRLGQLYANASYMYTDREEKTFKAITRADGHVEYDTSLLHFDNKVVRAGIYFEKKIESTQEHLPYVVFKVTLKETGETHYIMTNHNAYYGTDQLYNLHSNNTNGIDAIVKPYAEEGFIPQAIIDELIAKEAWNWGTWFGTSPIHDDEYALPFGSYDMEEIKSPANEKYFMYRNDDFKIWYNYQYHSFGTIFNREMGILTSAVDAGTNTREGFATKNAKILDTVTYNGLVPGASYELVATLMAKNAEGKWEQIKGIEVHKTFIPKVENHYEVMEIVFDASSYEDKDVVVFEELRDANGTVIAEHKSLTDAKQTVSYKPVPKSGMAIVKEALTEGTHDGKYWDGEIVKYRITVTNTGETILENIVVADAMLDFESTIARLLPGKSASFVLSYEVTIADVLAGKILNVATAEAEDPAPNPDGTSTTITVEDDEEVETTAPKRSMTIEKKEISTPKHEKGYWAGEVVKYKITVTNTGEVTLEDITVTDAKLGFEDVISRLMPGKSKSFTVEYVVTPAEAKAGKVHNVATAEVEDPYGPDGTSTTITVEDEEDVKSYEPKVGLSIAKVAVSEPKNGIAYLKGETVKYQIIVTNPGEVDLRDVEVEDAALEFEAYIGLLRSGKSRTFTVTYKITEEDTLSGKFVNIATATCEDPTSSTENPKPDLTEKDEEEVPAMEFKPGYEQNKEVVSIPKNGIAYVEGEVITFKLSLNNTGNQPLTITVKDELVSFEKEVKLAPGESWAEEVYYTVTKEDAEAGHVLNVMTSKGIPPYCPPEEPPVEITPPPVEQDPPTMVENPAYEQAKSVISKPKNGIAYVEGETITFKLSLKNTGNLPLIVKVSDKLLGFEEEVKLAVDGAWEVELPYEVTKEDAEAGHVLNVLTSKGTPERPPQYPDPESDKPIIPEDEEQDPPTMIEDPAYEQEKVLTNAPKNGVAYVEGEEVTYKIPLTNTGNLPLVIEVKDDLVGYAETIKLAIGETFEKDLSYTVTAEDVEAGTVLNVLTSSGKPERPEDYPDPEGDEPVVPEDKEVEVPTIDPKPHITIIKETVNKPANGVGFVEGEKIIFRITVINDGNMDFDRATVKDEMLDFEAVITGFMAGDKKSFDLKHTTTREEAKAGRIYNVATVEAPNPNEPNAPENPTITEKDDEENPATLTGTVTVIYVDKKGRVLIEKTVVLDEVPVGTEYKTTQEEIEHYRFVEMDEKSAPAAGKVVEGTQDVIYVYEKISPSKPTEPMKEPERDPEAIPETEPWNEEESKGNTPPAPIPFQNTPPETGDRNILPFYILLFIGTLGTMLLFIRGKDWEG